MIRDSITDEIRQVRHSLADSFNNDLALIVADLQRQQTESGRKYLTLPKRIPQTIEIAEQSGEPERD